MLDGTSGSSRVAWRVGGGGGGRTRHPARYSRSSGPRYWPCIVRLEKIIAESTLSSVPRLSLHRPEDVTMALGGLTYDEFAPHLQRYYQVFSGFVLEIFEEATKPPGESMWAIVPKRFWSGYQGLVNSIIVGRHIFKKAYAEVYGKEFDASTMQEKVRMFTRNGQVEFLAQAIRGEDKQWNVFLRELAGVFRSPKHKGLTVPRLVYLDLLAPEVKQVETARLEHQDNVLLTFELYFRMLFPDLFRYWNTPPDQHAHPWDIIASERYTTMHPKEAAHIIRHVFECDLGLVMNEVGSRIDPDLLNVMPDGNRFPRRNGFANWTEMMGNSGLRALLSAQPSIQGRYSAALELAYPWAFRIFTDGTMTQLADPDKYIRCWRLFEPRKWTNELLAVALRCEWFLEGKNWQDFPDVFGTQWMESKGISVGGRFNVMECVSIAFPEEVNRGLIKLEQLRDLKCKSAVGGYEGVHANPFRIASYGSISVAGVKYVVPEEFRDSDKWAFRLLGAGLIGVFEIVERPARGDKPASRRFELRRTFKAQDPGSGIRFVTIHEADLSPKS